MLCFDKAFGETVVGVVVPFCAMVGICVTAIYQFKSSRSTKEISRQVTRNGHSGKTPDDLDGSADALIKQLSYLGTKMDDHAQATASRFDTLDKRQLQTDTQMDDFRKVATSMMNAHLKQHKEEWAIQHKLDQEQEIAILKAQGRLDDGD